MRVRGPGSSSLIAPLSLAVMLSLPVVARAAAPPPYSTPWHLRPATPGRVLRLDTVHARYQDAAGADGATTVATLLASRKVSQRAALLGRLGVVHNAPPAAEAATVLTNLVIGGNWSPRPTAPLRVGFYLLTAWPTAGGGGDNPKPAAAAAIRSGVAARSAMDNALFAANDVVIFPGVELAFVRDGWTLQAEATVLQLWRVRGAAKQKDVRRTNLTTGLHVGRFLSPRVSLAAELRHQRWLSDPVTVVANPKARDSSTVAFGARLHLPTGKSSWLRPGLAVAIPLDAPLSDADYVTWQLDLPWSF